MSGTQIALATLVLTVTIQIIGFAFSYGIIYSQVRHLTNLPKEVQQLAERVTKLEARFEDSQKKVDLLFRHWTHEAIGNEGYVVEMKTKSKGAGV